MSGRRVAATTAFLLATLGSAGTGWWLSLHLDTVRARQGFEVGRAIFQQGRGADGRALIAHLGPERIPLAGPAAACASCHRADGRGGVEGGVTAPPITGAHLFSARLGGDPATRRRAYDVRTLGAALREGFGGQRRLGIAMPRFELSGAELDGLVAYLRSLDVDGPGVSPTEVVVGFRAPRGAPDASTAALQVLQAYVREVNARGGLYGRRLVLAVADEGAAGESPAANVLAWVSSAPWGAAGDGATPEVLPLELEPRADELPGGTTFHLYPSLGTQARWLVQQLDEWTVRAAGGRVGVIAARGRAGEAWAEEAAHEAERRGWSVRALWLEPPADPKRTADWLAKQGLPAAFVFADSATLGALVDRVAQRRLPVRLFAPWPALSGPAPPKSPLVAFPDPLASTGAQRREFETFHRRHRLAEDGLPVQRHAYMAAKVLVEALERAGERVDRARLVSALQTLTRVETGAGPPVSFDAMRRVGLDGAALRRFDPAEDAWRIEQRWTRLRR